MTTIAGASSDTRRHGIGNTRGVTGRPAGCGLLTPSPDSQLSHREAHDQKQNSGLHIGLFIDRQPSIGPSQKDVEPQTSRQRCYGTCKALPRGSHSNNNDDQQQRCVGVCHVVPERNGTSASVAANGCRPATAPAPL